jgi:hypothetical protein
MQAILMTNTVWILFPLAVLCVGLLLAAMALDHHALGDVYVIALIAKSDLIAAGQRIGAMAQKEHYELFLTR